MNIFNRKEIFVTMDLQKFGQISSILDKENINYTYKTFNTSGARPGTIQSIGLNSKCMIQYYIYVHKKDYDKACWVLRDNKLF
ncbi:MAG: hypothetical protein K0S47_3416 [Herbinix sp.]|jgi:hypothetical protein|nr:hypothetical protein [Herbinix sp.]